MVMKNLYDDSGMQDLYAKNNDDLMSLANNQVREENSRMGLRPAPKEEEKKEEKKSGQNMGDAYNMYKKYSTQAGSKGAGGLESNVSGTASQADAVGEMAGGGEGGGMGGVANVLAIIYAADQVKKGTGGYDRQESRLVLGADGHYHAEKGSITEIPWDEKTRQQKTTDAPGTAGALAPLYVLGQAGGEDSEFGKQYKEMARLEKQAFEPITKIISWLGLDINPEEEGEEL